MSLNLVYFLALHRNRVEVRKTQILRADIGGFKSLLKCSLAGGLV